MTPFSNDASRRTHDAARMSPHKLTGRRYWRSLDELENTPEFRAMLEREFPEDASVMSNPVTRRAFLRLMGASVALASLTGCGFLRRPEDHIVPYTKMPEHVVPGRPLHYATSFDLGGVANGLLAEAHVGRPTKLEGNTLHPHSLGAADAFAQASILELYDPDRSNEPVMRSAEGDKAVTWAEFEAYWQTHAAKLAAGGGKGLAFLEQDVPSPLLDHLKSAVAEKYPNAVWYRHDPVSRDNARTGSRIAFGRIVETNPDYSKADVVASIDCDFLGVEPGHVRAIKEYAKRRRVRSTEDSMNRLYVIESNFSVTGANADHRVRLKPSKVVAFAAALAVELKKLGVALTAPDAVELDDASRKRAGIIAADLVRAAKNRRALVVAGRRQPPGVHALVHALNAALGSVGATVSYTPSRTRDARPIEELARGTNGKIHTLILLGGNPVYDAPADLDFAGALKKIENTIHIGLHRNETGRACGWHLPESHFLESWGDRRATDGLVSIVQPLVYPLYPSKSQPEFLAMLAGKKDPDGRALLRDYWNRRDDRLTSDSRWKKILHDGIVPDTRDSAVQPDLDANFIAAQMNLAAQAVPAGQYELVFAEDPSVFDGRYANNGWLQELPDPMTKITWDNPAIVSVATAAKLGVKSEDMINITAGGRSLAVAVWIMPGVADNTIILNLGYGRTAAGQVGDGVGFDTYKLRAASTLDSNKALIARAAGRYLLASTQAHFAIDAYGAETRTERAKQLVQEADVKDYRKKPDFARNWPLPEPDVNKSIFKEFKYDTGNQWGMVIDLNSCVGCNACTVACQAENNIPIVGKEQVATGREMHWIRLDRYFVADKGREDEAEAVSQPVACQQCENAPCETVCPVAATTHSEEGLNDMTYNRCIGTRYCQNNCPYKVRRFNFFNWTGSRDMIQRGKAKDLFERVVQKDTRGTLQMAHNPDVTVRSRGVMEKCTYCVQRISEAKIDAKAQGHETVPDSMAPVPACAQTCPADAIVMGNINDPDSRVSKLRKLDRGYEILAELNTRPRTTFLARLRNPNPEWA